MSSVRTLLSLALIAATVACSGSKWNASAVALVAPLDAVDVLVTDKQLSTEELAQLTQHSVEVVIV